MNLKTLSYGLLSVALAACGSSPRTVENPLIETANTMVLDVSRVELTDTATIVKVDAYFNPHMWIKIASDTYLRADGKKYALTGAEGITPDSLFWMPESGEASFRLTFQPLPLRTKSFDFIESDCEDCFKLFGIDLTGKKAYDAPRNIPAEALAMDGDAPMPAPIFQSGETTVEVHLLNYREELGKILNLYVNNMIGGQQEEIASIDPETGTVTFRFMQYGPAQALLVMGRDMVGNGIWLAPGEHASFYIDMRTNGQRLVARRNDYRFPALRLMYATGTYANLNNVWNREPITHFRSMDLYGENSASCHEMSAKDYTEFIQQTYRATSDSIANDTLCPLAKEVMQWTLKQQTVGALVNGDYTREQSYRWAHKDWDYEHPVKGIEKLTTEQQASVCQLFSLDEPMLLMGIRPYEYASYVAYADEAWAKAANIQGGLVGSLRKFARLVRNADGGDLDEKDLSVFTPEESFYAEALKTMKQTTLDKLKAVEGQAVIEPTPEVPTEELFETIVAPYRGKVILVDFWNTWCGPCRAALKQTEPLKDTVLKDDNLIWIYIADETSPLVQYKTVIPGIKGKHFRLNDKQWAYLCKMFGIDGIPSYVVVDPDGSYGLRNDLRDHSRLVTVLKEKLEKK